MRLLKPPLATVSCDSWLWIAGRSAAVELFEQSAVSERVVSNALIAELGTELSRVFAAGEASALDDLLEAGSLAAVSEPLLAVEAGEQQPGDEHALGHGVYVVRGAVNPGEEGHVTLRAIDATSDTTLDVTALPAPLEYVGWSADVSRSYRYGFDVIVEDRDEREQIAARFELWFTPRTADPAAPVERRTGHPRLSLLSCGAPRRACGVERGADRSPSERRRL